MGLRISGCWFEKHAVGPRAPRSGCPTTRGRAWSRPAVSEICLRGVACGPDAQIRRFYALAASFLVLCRERRSPGAGIAPSMRCATRRLRGGSSRGLRGKGRLLRGSRGPAARFAPRFVALRCTTLHYAASRIPAARRAAQVLSLGLALIGRS